MLGRSGFNSLRGLRETLLIGVRYRSSGPVSFSSITDSISSEKDISNLVTPSSAAVGNSKRGGKLRPQLVPVKYVLNCLFAKNNTHFTFSAVVEDVNYLRNNPDISYNEAFLYYLKLPQKVKFALSTGVLGFRKAARGEYEAAFQTSAKVFQMIQDKKLMNKDIEIVMREFGKGRAAFVAALNGKEGAAIRSHVTRISDKTPLKFGGVRAPRVRRL
ncbi:hypothetical protein HG536_0E02370 [Torulaspora globosa]|uniref:Small ribosomal subunit protein uS11m n=1 Tax=Torulaspora globosa TaxID=48254 RepID=A0A7G3ZIJ0_9SACH|nr:uncharacterized protein HG536_0E02370 [Torulaspora globosa]QLL33326.1 hypothetical protein HG536_0E02370 [Torulaspora globosa]